MSQIVCKDCGSSRLVKSQDKSKPVGYRSMMPIYATKYECKDCRFSWSE